MRSVRLPALVGMTLAVVLMAPGVAAADPGANARTAVAAVEQAVATVGGPATADAPTRIPYQVRATWADGARTTVGTSTHVRGGRDAAAVIQPVRDGVRGLAVIDGPAAPRAYGYALDGGAFAQRPDGTVDAVDAKGKPVGTVSPAWAVDADGVRVPTRYEVRDGRLVQHVDHAGADYPVVADPTVSFGWYIYIRYSRAEVQNLRWAVEFNADYGPAICGIIPLAPAAVACAIVVGMQWSSIRDTWLNAANRNQCFEFRMRYAVIVGWRGYDC